jgi:hypothetical protein
MRKARTQPRGTRKKEEFFGASFVLSWDGRLIEHLRDKVPADELWITWRPRIVGGETAKTLTGLRKKFFPQSIPMELRKLERVGDECRARYGSPGVRGKSH